MMIAIWIGSPESGKRRPAMKAEAMNTSVRKLTAILDAQLMHESALQRVRMAISDTKMPLKNMASHSVNPRCICQNNCGIKMFPTAKTTKTTIQGIHLAFLITARRMYEFCNGSWFDSFIIVGYRFYLFSACSLYLVSVCLDSSESSSPLSAGMESFHNRNIFDNRETSSRFDAATFVVSDLSLARLYNCGRPPS